MTTTTGSLWDDVDAVRYPDDGEVAEPDCAAPYLHHATRSGADEITATDDNGNDVVLRVVEPEDGETCTGCAGDRVTVWAEGRWWSSEDDDLLGCTHPGGLPVVPTSPGRAVIAGVGTPGATVAVVPMIWDETRTDTLGHLAADGTYTPVTES